MDRGPLLGWTATALVGWIALAGCGGKGEPGATTAGPTPADSIASEIFVDQAAAAGLDFFHFNGMTGQYHMAEVTGSGVALFDYDNDGDLDVYLVQGNMLAPGKSPREATFPPRHPVPLTDHLYRNDLDPKTGHLTLTDVTAESGLEARGYGMGVAVGDYDGDGWLDLYLTNVGENQLLRNNGGQAGLTVFSDVTASAGAGDDRWSVPAVFFDHDGDGWLDLYVGNYLLYPDEDPPVCRDFTGALDYCGPQSFRPESDRLLRNRGADAEGRVTFEEATASAGLTGGFGPALGVVAADFNGDHLVDLYVTNDAAANNLWLNQAAGGSVTFRDDALLAGCAVNGRGRAEASMGVDTADFDGDGDLDLFMTHLITETNTLFRNNGQGVFSDDTVALGLGAESRVHTSFGTAWLDYDNDGWLDLFVANGAVKKIKELLQARDPFPFHETNQLLRNLEGERFEDVTDGAGQAFELSEVSRGAAVGDIDNDGDIDVLLSNNNGPARLLLNQVGNKQHWLGLRLLDSGRDAPGARVELLRSSRPPLVRRVRFDGSFASANDPRVLFGLGESPEVDGLRVRWPDGMVEEWDAVEPGRYTTLRRGSGRPAPP